MWFWSFERILSDLNSFETTLIGPSDRLKLFVVLLAAGLHDGVQVSASGLQMWTFKITREWYTNMYDKMSTWQCKYISASGAELNWNEAIANCDCGATPFTNISSVPVVSSSTAQPEVINSYLVESFSSALTLGL